MRMATAGVLIVISTAGTHISAASVALDLLVAPVPACSECSTTFLD